jgi:hypothetical protein
MFALRLCVDMRVSSGAVGPFPAVQGPRASSAMDIPGGKVVDVQDERRLWWAGGDRLCHAISVAYAWNMAQ